MEVIHVVHGITPIYMGSTLKILHFWPGCGDHPHIHGEHPQVMAQMLQAQGSPPYTWGARSATLNRDSPLEDHPHIHGEHPTITLRRSAMVGSPPYTWGAPYNHSKTFRDGGITPIYMGSTLITEWINEPTGDHPHIHGEHVSSPS